MPSDIRHPTDQAGDSRSSTVWSPRKSPRTRRWWLLRIGAGLALGLAAPGVIAFRAAWKARSLLHLPRQRVNNSLHSKIAANLRDVQFKTADGLILRGWYLPPRRRAVVLMLHGVGENRTRFIPDAHILAEKGYGVFLFDFRGNGESDGNIITWGDAERRDYEAALTFLRSQPEVDARRIGVIGFSMGASVAAQMASDQVPAAMVLEGYSATLEEDIRDDFHRWGALSEMPALWVYQSAGVHVRDVHPIRTIATMRPRPLLMIQGDVELRKYGQSTDPMLSVAPEPKQYWQVPGADHGEYAKLAPAEYTRRISKFFRHSLPLMRLGEQP